MMTRSSQSLTTINVADSARKLDVNNRISLRYYFRIADNILKQAAIFRREGDIIELYIMLLRFSSLVTESIPYHREYKASPQSNKIYLKKKLLGAIAELEDIKSAVQQKIEDSKRKQVHEVNWSGFQHQNNYLEYSLDRPIGKLQNLNGHTMSKDYSLGVHDNGYSGQRTPQESMNRPVEEQFWKLALSVPRPTVETLSRHSILGPQGLHGHRQPPPSDKRALYPSNIDRSPVEISSVYSVQKPVEAEHLIPVENERLISNDRINSVCETEKSESTDQSKKDSQLSKIEEPVSLISFDTAESTIMPTTKIIRQPSPPPVLADIQDLIPTTSPTTEAGSVSNISSSDGLVCVEAPLELHIPTSVMDNFLRLAKSNTSKNLETCGILAGSLKNRKFYITALIIPKQESTSNSCQATNEEEIFEVQDKQSLFPLGWIHTHPTQSCFMSSIDVHTHYSYQIMLPEAIAIVMAPTDTSRKHGIFRLTRGGLTVIKQCPMRGFHSHDPPVDGSPIYKQCTDVYINPNLPFDVIDLR